MRRAGAWAAARLTPLAPHRWGLAVVLACGVVYLTLYAAEPRVHNPGADGFYGWLYARSLVFDGDLDFANDYRLCGDPWGTRSTAGPVDLDNPFYPGPSLFWTPVLWGLKHLVSLPSAAPLDEQVGCRGLLAALTLALAPLLGTASIALGYRAARRFASDGEAALAAAFVAVGGSIAAYATMLASYSHIYATFATALLVWASVRAGERGDLLRRWVVVAGALLLCVLQRLNFASMACCTGSCSRQASTRDRKRNPRSVNRSAGRVSCRGPLHEALCSARIRNCMTRSKYRTPLPRWLRPSRIGPLRAGILPQPARTIVSGRLRKNRWLPSADSHTWLVALCVRRVLAPPVAGTRQTPRRSHRRR